MMKTLLSCSILLLLISVLAANSNEIAPATSSADALASKINMSKLSGWKEQGSQGVYICAGTAACPTPRYVLYRTAPSSQAGLATMKNAHKDRRAAEQEYQKVFSGLGQENTGSLQIVGVSQNVEEKDIKGMGFFLKSEANAGSPAFLGYALMFPGETKVHIFISATNTHKIAKSDVVLVSQAWTPKP